MSGNITDRMAHLLEGFFGGLRVNPQSVFYIMLNPSPIIISGHSVGITTNNSATIAISDQSFINNIDWGQDDNVGKLSNIYKNLCEYENIDNNDFDSIKDLLARCREELCRIKSNKSLIRFREYVTEHILQIISEIEAQSGSKVEKLSIYDKKLISDPGSQLWRVKQHNCSLKHVGVKIVGDADLEVIYDN